MVASTAINAHTASIHTIIAPRFKGIVDARTIATYFIKTAALIKKSDLPIRIYVAEDLADKIVNLLVALGIKFKTMPASRLEPPYIFLDLVNGDLVLRTVDTNGRVVAEYKVPLTKFISALEELLANSRRGRDGKRVKEIVISKEDAKEILEKLNGVSP